MRKYFLLFTIAPLMTACVLSQAATQAPTETQATIPRFTSSVTVPATTAAIPTGTTNSCTDRGWADISTYITEFQYQAGNFANGVIVTEYLKTLRSINEKIVSVTIDSCTEHARELVLSSMDNRLSGQEMMMTGSFGDPNALMNALMQERPLMEAANAELAGLGLQVILPMPGSVPVTLPSTPPMP
jgi:hypothetical protein